MKGALLRKAQTIFVVTGLLGALVGAWLIAISFQPPSGRPNVGVRFLGYFQYATGARVARFAISNQTPNTVSRLAMLDVQTPSGATGRFLSGYANLGADAEEVLIVAPPTNPTPWRISLYVYPRVGFARVIKNLAALVSTTIGRKPGAQTMPYQIDGDWIDNGGTK